MIFKTTFIGKLDLKKNSFHLPVHLDVMLAEFSAHLSHTRPPISGLHGHWPVTTLQILPLPVIVLAAMQPQAK